MTSPPQPPTFVVKIFFDRAIIPLRNFSYIRTVFNTRWLNRRREGQLFHIYLQLSAFSPRVNYTDRATASCQRN
jgi:hypothetical protein